MNPLQTTVRWLASHTLFPVSRLDSRAEAMICISALAAAEDAAAMAATRHLVQSRDGAKDAALRAYNHRRNLVHYVCDNAAKV
jgi:hypothetical protein